MVFPEVEVLDFCGPFEVFSVTRLNENRRREEPSPYEVILVAENKEPVVATGGLKVLWLISILLKGAIARHLRQMRESSDGEETRATAHGEIP